MLGYGAFARPEGEQSFYVICLAFWTFFAVRAWRAVRWRRKGLEVIQLDGDTLTIPIIDVRGRRVGAQFIDADGKKKFSLFTLKDRAWAETPELDSKIVLAMKSGNKLLVSGTSSRGTKTEDTYSLFGFTASLKLIDKACGR